MAILTNYAGGDPYAAADHNDENELTLLNAKLLTNGSAIHTDLMYSGNQGNFYTDDGNIVIYNQTNAGTSSFRVYNATTLTWESRTVTSDWAASDWILGAAKIGAYLYVLLHDLGTPETRVYRYAYDDLASGGTQMTATFFGAAAVVPKMTSDGTDLFFTNDAGDDLTNDYEILRASISGTTLTEVEVITCGSTAGYFDKFGVDDTYIYAVDSGSPYYIRKYDRATGTLQATSGLGLISSNIINSEDVILLHTNKDSSAPHTLSKIPV